MKRFIMLWAALYAGLGTAQVAARDTVLQPSGEWQDLRGDEFCGFSRQFGEGEDTVTLYLYSFGPQGAYRVSVAGRPVVRDTWRAKEADIAFGEDAMQRTPAIASGLGDGGVLTFQATGDQYNVLFSRGRVDRPLPVAVRFRPDARTLRLNAADMEPLTLALGHMGPQFGQLEACETALMEEWGLDPATQSAITRPPRLTNGERMAYWIKYPANLLLNRVSRIVQFRATVNAAGEVEECVVQAPGWDERDRRDICRKVKRGAEFEPARDAQGEPVRSLFRASYMMLMFD